MTTCESCCVRASCLEGEVEMDDFQVHDAVTLGRRGRRKDFDFHPSTFAVLDSRYAGTSGGPMFVTQSSILVVKMASHGATPSLRLLPRVGLNSRKKQSLILTV